MPAPKAVRNSDGTITVAVGDGTYRLSPGDSWYNDYDAWLKLLEPPKAAHV